MDDLNDLAQEVITTYANLELTIGLVESMTGGLIGHLLTNIDGSSRVFGGSLVVYTAQAKHLVLNIPMDFIANEGTISDKMVEKMLDYMTQYPLDVILAISGVAGKQVEAVPHGTVYIGINNIGNIKIQKFFFEGSREEIKKQAARKSLNLLLQTVEHL